jgi:addiction module HigA family antidote
MVEKEPPGHRVVFEDVEEESINRLAQAIRVPANRIGLIVNGRRGITADTAARLSRYFDLSAVLAEHPEPLRSRLAVQGRMRREFSIGGTSAPAAHEPHLVLPAA